MTRWTYHREHMTDGAAVSLRLAELGADGWELVAVRPGKEGAAAEWIFKRPIPGSLVRETKAARHAR